MSSMRVRTLIFHMFFGTMENRIEDNVVCSIDAVRWDSPAILGLGAAHHQNLAKEDAELRDFFAGQGLGGHA